MSMFRKGILTTVCALVLAAQTASASSIKNVVLLISDGQGFNTVRATEYYTGGKACYEASDWVKLGMQTNSANNPAGYNAAAMAANFNYAKSGATDSASAASAMYTGQKIYDGQINMTTTGKPIQTFFEKAAVQGKSVGAVSSVQLSHATPAAVYAHSDSRNKYDQIGKEAVYGSNPGSHNAGYDANNYYGNLKVVMGAGHPDFDNNNQSNPGVSDKYVGGSTAWSDLQGGVNGWSLVEDKADFQALATGATPDKVFGVAKVNGTLQQSRSGGAPMNTNVPTLEEMTKAALNVLDNNTEGFVVMIEGGAVDWANHANQVDRMMEEQIDFNNTVQAVCDYLDAGVNGNTWANTLVIVTADHECGHVWGDGTAGWFDVNGNGTYEEGVDYGYVGDNGAGSMPGVKHFSGSHTNALVPFYAKGAGSEMFGNYVIGTDGNLVDLYNLSGYGFDGQYIDNTAVFDVMNTSTIPEPATMVMLTLGGLGILARRRRAAA